MIHDKDCSFSKALDAVFQSEGISSIPTPFQAPHANADAERWVRTVREECLDHMLIIHAQQHVLIEFSLSDNTARPHPGIDQHVPILDNIPKNTGFVQRRKVLGGILNDYFRSSDRYLLPPFDFISVQ